MGLEEPLSHMETIQHQETIALTAARSATPLSREPLQQAQTLLGDTLTQGRESTSFGDTVQ